MSSSKLAERKVFSYGRWVLLVTLVSAFETDDSLHVVSDGSKPIGVLLVCPSSL